MRINRAKLVRKFLRFYRLSYLLNPPYHVLLDGNFIFSALKNKIDIGDRLTKLLQGEDYTLYVLRSALDELRELGAKGETAVNYCTSRCTLLDDSAVRGETPFEKTVAYIGSD